MHVNGTADLDFDRFWRQNALCRARLDGSASRPALELMFEELLLTGIMPDLDFERYYTDLVYRSRQHRRANDRFEMELGIRPYGEDRLIYMKGALEVRLGARRELTRSGTAWLQPAIETVDQLSAWIDRTGAIDLRTEPVPESWRRDGEAFATATGGTVSFIPSMTGPVTMAGALLGQMNLCLWAMDQPDLMDRFFAVLCTKQIEFFEALHQEENGRIPRDGIGINDDCCYLFSPTLYDRYCAPYLTKLFQAFAPEPGHRRRQHSDSAMGHLMGILRGLGVNEVNFGPELHPLEIRQAMPEAVIVGQMPPFLLRNGGLGEIADIVRRDYEALGKVNAVQGPAGVVAGGTPFRSLRAYMAAVQGLAEGC